MAGVMWKIGPARWYLSDHGGAERGHSRWADAMRLATIQANQQQRRHRVRAGWAGGWVVEPCS